MAAATALSLRLAASTPGQKEFSAALSEAKSGHLDAAFLLAERAAQAAPEDARYRTVREFLRQRATLANLDRAHALVLARHPSEAALEFRSALALEPSNLDAHQGLAGLYPQARTATSAAVGLRVEHAAPPIELAPQKGERDFDVAESLHVLLGQVAGAYGLKAYVADSVPDTRIRLNISRANFAEAMTALHDVAGVDEIALDRSTLYFIGTQDLARVAPVAARTFYVPWASGVELNEVATVLKTLLDLNQMTVDTASGAIAVRARPEQLDAAEQLLLDLQRARGEVVLDIQILEVNATTARTLGLGVPDQFTMFALGPLLKQLEQNGNQAQEILQLFQQGGLNAILNSGQLGGLLAGLASTLSPLLQNPFVTFGGGATLMAVSVPNATASFNATNGRFQSVESAVLRSLNGQQATLTIGQRIPILNASFSPISLSPAISKVIANGSFLQPFPSFSYQDVGFNAKITPHLNQAGGIGLQLDLTSSALAGQSINGIPILSNRHVLTNLSLTNGEPAVVGGLFTRNEMTTLSGLPGIGEVPGFGKLFATQSRQTTNDQLMLVITPHIVQAPGAESAGIWLPPGFGGAGGTSAAPPSNVNRPLPYRLGGGGE